MSEKITPTHSQIADFLTDDIVSEITLYLMEDFGVSLEQALDTIYTSDIIKKLQNEEAELYVQSPSYVYELLRQEKNL